MNGKDIEAYQDAVQTRMMKSQAIIDFSERTLALGDDNYLTLEYAKV